MEQNALRLETLPFPVLWMVAFVAICWFVWRNEGLLRWAFLILWVPSVVGATAIHKLATLGYPLGESLRLLVHHDRSTLRLVFDGQLDAAAVAYAVVVGSAVAALGTLVVALAVVLAAAGLHAFPRGAESGETA